MPRPSQCPGHHSTQAITVPRPSQYPGHHSTQAITDSISPFQREIADELRTAGYEADSDTMIAKGRGGYELARNIEADAETVETPASESTEPTSQERVQWFIAEAEAGRKHRKAMFLKRFGVSESTWKRDLRLISDRLEVVGTGGAAYYLLHSKIQN